MTKTIIQLKAEVEALKRDYFYVKNETSSAVLQEAIEARETEINKLEEQVTPETKLSCSAEDSSAFELAITQLGFRVKDSTWDDEKELMHYVVVER